MSVKTYKDIYMGSTTSQGITTSATFSTLFRRWGSIDGAINSCAAIHTGWGPLVQSAVGFRHPQEKEQIILPCGNTSGSYALTTGPAFNSLYGPYKLFNFQNNSTQNMNGPTWVNSNVTFYLAGLDRSKIIMVPSIQARNLQGQTWSGSLKNWSETYGRTYTYIVSANVQAYYKQDISSTTTGSNFPISLLSGPTGVSVASGVYNDGKSVAHSYVGSYYPYARSLSQLITTDTIYNEGGATYWQSFFNPSVSSFCLYYYNYLHYKKGVTGDGGHAPFWYYEYSDVVDWLNRWGLWWAEDRAEVANCHGPATESPYVHVPQIDDNGYLTGEMFSGSTDPDDSNSITNNFDIGGDITGIYNPLGGYDFTGYNNTDPTKEPLTPQYPVQYPQSLPSDSTELDLETNEYNGVGIFGTYYCGNRTMIEGINNVLWNTDQGLIDRVIAGLKLYGSDPVNAIMSLRIYPFAVSGQVPCSSTNVVLGVVDLGVPMFKIAENATIAFELGSMQIEPEFNNFLDLAPYTAISVYIPCVGIVELSTNDFMGKALRIQMSVDITTGQCTACIYAGQTPIKYASGQMGVEIPITASTGEEYSKAFIETAANGAAGFASGGLAGAAVGVAEGVMNNFGTLFFGAAAAEKTGIASPSNAFTMPMKCFVIISRPNVIMPENYAHTYGKVCHTSGILNEFSGFTVCKNVDTSNLTATEEERNMIKAFLESGVYV